MCIRDRGLGVYPNWALLGYKGRAWEIDEDEADVVRKMCIRDSTHRSQNRSQSIQTNARLCAGADVDHIPLVEPGILLLHHEVIPVSYTHLDVYKRQGSTCAATGAENLKM